jgi:threonylcarbamoyladenosine tRNA methylthiotransferase MtaB
MTFTIITLGCKVNTYESNVIKDILINNGYHESMDTLADIYIVNTCTVTDTSDKKSLKMIRQCLRKNSNAIVVVCGCMSQINPKLAIAIGASVIIGNGYKNRIHEYISQYIDTGKQIVKVDDIMESQFESMMLNNFDRTRAFVKIEDGCENYCTFCIIPYARGKVRSKDPHMVLEEINTLVKQGHREIVLTGIHTGHYGGDLINYTFHNLLEDIIKIDGLERLRISSIEITEIDDNILDLLNNTSIIVDHLHIPIQSGCNSILKAMNRKYDKEYFINKVNTIRNIRPDISLTTDLIVGFPGETLENFNETIETLKIINFSKIHVFPFSLRKGTKAEELTNHLDEYTKKCRVKIVMELSLSLETAYINRFIGKEVTFIPEKYLDGSLIGHTGNYLLIKTIGDSKRVHELIKVKIIKADYPYLIGQYVKEE